MFRSLAEAIQPAVRQKLPENLFGPLKLPFPKLGRSLFASPMLEYADF